MSDSETPSLAVRALGVPIGIQARDADLPRLRRQWSRALDPGESPVAVVGPVPRDERDPAGRTRTTTRSPPASRWPRWVTAGARLNLHAGGVADRDGRVLAVVGASGAGKTTATRALARRLGYVSDETISIEPGAPYVVHAHPKPLSVVVDPAEPRRKSQHGPDELGLRTAPPELRLHRLVVLHRPAGSCRALRRDRAGPGAPRRDPDGRDPPDVVADPGRPAAAHAGARAAALRPGRARVRRDRPPPRRARGTHGARPRRARARAGAPPRRRARRAARGSLGAE